MSRKVICAAAALRSARPPHVPRRFLFLCAVWVAIVCLGSLGLVASPARANETSSKKAIATATASPTPGPSASAQSISELKAEISALKAKLDLIESQQEETARQTFSTTEQLTKDKDAQAAAAKARPPGSGVRIGTDGTDVRLYGLLEATLGGMTHTTTGGAPQIGMPVSWFSGNRWGVDLTQRLSKIEGKQPSNNFNLIAKLESEFELPSGNMDTPGVLFNRDAWVGVQSKDFGKLTLGRQNALPRDVAQIWGDPYGAAANSLNEGGFSNVNNFKQLIYYAGGGNGANGQGDTRYDAAIVWKKLFDNGLFLSAGYNFADDNGPGGPNGTGPVSGAEFNKGSTLAAGLGFNAGRFHTSAFYTSGNVLVPKTIGDGNIGAQDQSVGIGANYDWGGFRLNTGFIAYTGDQGALGRRNDKAWTVSTKLAPSRYFDYELGVQEFYAKNAAVNGSGFVLRPFRNAIGATNTINGSRFTVYGSLIMHPVPNIDVYLVGDDLLTGGGYLDGRANGFKHQNETAMGARFKF